VLGDCRAAVSGGAQFQESLKKKAQGIHWQSPRKAKGQFLNRPSAMISPCSSGGK
jgi:hypothetical protein